MNHKDSYAVGGQAVIEGVMMRGKNKCSIAVRNVNTNEIITKFKDLKPINSKILKLPIIRGIIAFVNNIFLGIEIIMISSDLSGIDKVEDKTPSKFEAWISKKLGEKMSSFLIYFSVIISIILSIILFMILPIYISNFILSFINLNNIVLSLTEGTIRIIIFLIYLYITSKLKDAQRIYMYHGAEHKAINCYESGEELNLFNVKKQTRFHKRCGTSFLMIVMIVSMLLFIFIKTNSIFSRILTRIIFVPLIAGISYELIRLAGKYDNFIVKLISFPGIYLQKLTTKEPTDDIIEVAIVSLKGILKYDE